MTSVRPETTFEICGEKYPRRPTFDIIAAIESRFGPIWPLLRRLQSAEFGMSETAQAITLILGPPKNGGPKPEAVNEEVFARYTDNLLLLTVFLTDGVTDPNARPQKPETE